MLKFFDLTTQQRLDYLQDLFRVANSVPDTSKFGEYGFVRGVHMDSFIAAIAGDPRLSSQMNLGLDMTGTTVKVTLDGNHPTSTSELVHPSWLGTMLFRIRLDDFDPTKDNFLLRIAQAWRMTRQTPNYYATSNSVGRSLNNMVTDTEYLREHIFPLLGVPRKMRITFDTEAQC